MARAPSKDSGLRSAAVVISVAIALVIAGLGIRRSRAPSALPPPAAPSPRATFRLGVPHAQSPVVIDGDTKDPAWLAGPARTGAFVGPNGTPSVPYSDARFVWGDGNLYVVLYAADFDIRVHECKADGPVWLGDSFHLTFTTGNVVAAIDVSPLGTVTDAIRTSSGAFDYGWQSGARVAHDFDGTANDSSDEDEEWLLEMAIPLRSLGLRGEVGEHVRVSVRRCDTPASGPRVCGSWGEGAQSSELVLE